MAAFTTAAPHRSKRRIPPGPDAHAAAAALRGDPLTPTGAAGAAVIDMSAYAEGAARRRTVP